MPEKLLIIANRLVLDKRHKLNKDLGLKYKVLNKAIACIKDAKV